MRAQSNFSTLKRVVFPVNVSMDERHQYHFAEADKGTHWVGVDICLETDAIDIHD